MLNLEGLKNYDPQLEVHNWPDKDSQVKSLSTVNSPSTGNLFFIKNHLLHNFKLYIK